tara:strand:+ start:3515 stop:4402 length:888 start_codon:yes stop_codon:yes gene_type:complete
MDKFEPKNLPMGTSNAQEKLEVKNWFQQLRDRICYSFESLEEELCEHTNTSSPGKFVPKKWIRDQGLGGGGKMSIMHGHLFEKVGVNISTVHGEFSKEFSDSIPGTKDNSAFWATGISVVAHPQSPLVPAVHMNTRHIVTSKSWFGGGADLTPTIPNDLDAKTFHNALKKGCDKHNPEYYQCFKDWCREYFFLPHRNEERGVGGIFYDYLNTGTFSSDLSFTKTVGLTFLNVYTNIVRQHMQKPWTEKDKEHQLIKRGRYAEFNLLYDRGTQFGLKTGGNIEAILMSMPPNVKWP